MEDGIKISYMYPYGYEDELATKRALVTERFEHSPQPDDDIIRSLGWIALAPITGGITTGRFETETPTSRTLAEKHVRALGATPLAYLAMREQATPVVDEATVLGYADARAA
jgi:hypothetical protein